MLLIPCSCTECDCAVVREAAVRTVFWGPNGWSDPRSPAFKAQPAADDGGGMSAVGIRDVSETPGLVWPGAAGRPLSAGRSSGSPQGRELHRRQDPGQTNYCRGPMVASRPQAEAHPEASPRDARGCRRVSPDSHSSLCRRATEDRNRIRACLAERTTRGRHFSPV